MRNARVRLFLRKRLDAATQRKLFADVLIMDAATEAISELYDHCEGDSNSLTDFMDWLLANSDAIMALIQKLIELFS